MHSGVEHTIFAVGRKDATGITLLGTAFALDKAGFCATCSHVVGADDTGLVIVTKDLGSIDAYQDTSATKVQYYNVKIVAANPLYDTAVLKTDNDGLRAATLEIGGSDSTVVGTGVDTYGYPHADQGRMVLTQQQTHVGAKVLISAGGIKAKHLILNIQTRPGQSGSPIFLKDRALVVGIIVGSYAPGGGGQISMGGVDPHTLHQTTHAVSAEYLRGMY